MVSGQWSVDPRADGDRVLAGTPSMLGSAASVSTDWRGGGGSCRPQRHEMSPPRGRDTVRVETRISA